MPASSVSRRARAALLAAAAIAAAAPLAPAPLEAQRRAAPGGGPRIELAPYAGYMVFGDYADGPLGTRLTSANGTILGAQLGLKLTPNIALVGHLGRASSELQVGAPIIGGIGVGSSEVWLYDASLQLSAGGLGAGVTAVRPFVQLGVGGARHELGAIGLSTNATNLTFNAGLGADVDLTPSIGLRLMAKDYVGRFDVQQATAIDVESDLRHNFAFSVGLRLGF